MGYRCQKSCGFVRPPSNCVGLFPNMYTVPPTTIVTGIVTPHKRRTIYSNIAFVGIHYAQMLHGAGIFTNIYPQNHPVM